MNVIHMNFTGSFWRFYIGLHNFLRRNSSHSSDRPIHNWISPQNPNPVHCMATGVSSAGEDSPASTSRQLWAHVQITSKKCRVILEK